MAALGPTAIAAASVAQAQAPADPQIVARAAIVVEYPSGRILYSKAMHERIPPASLTKILTAIMLLEYGKLDEVATVAPEDLVGESAMGLVSGEQQTLRNLLYGLMLPSGNDAAMTIGRYLGSRGAGGDALPADPMAKFAELMNARVAQLGLTDSRFVNPHGLDAPEHYSTAYDLASLTWYALHFPAFNEIVRQVSYDAPGHSLMNTNEMLTRYAGADGVKTGWTDGCGLCLVTSATRDGHRLIAVVLGSARWYSESAAILDYGFAKLAVTPLDSTAEVLGVSKRGTGTWLLEGGATPLPLGVAGRGGGSAPAIEAPAIESEEEQPSAVKPVRAERGGSTSSAAERAGVLVMSPRSNADSTVWSLALFAAVSFVLLYLLATRLFRVGRFLIHARRPFATATLPTASRTRRSDRVASYSTTPNSLSKIRTLGESPHAPRRQPNLLVTEEEERELRVERALSLAEEGRQGSSMSEFLQALRLGVTLEVSELAERYQMSPSAFLALSRAQQAMGRYEDARRTLVHAVLVIPEDRLLRLALNQLRD